MIQPSNLWHYVIQTSNLWHYVIQTSNLSHQQLCAVIGWIAVFHVVIDEIAASHSDLLDY
jgi:hypothetical protein